MNRRLRCRSFGCGAILIAAALASLLAALPAAAQPTPGNPLEILPGSFKVTPSTTQAAAHEDLTTEFDFAHDSSTAERTHQDVRTTIVKLPSGFLGSNTAVPTCNAAQLLAVTGVHNLAIPQCPVASQIGKITLDLNVNAGEVPPSEVTVPVYNMEVTTPGIAAEYGFKTSVSTQVLPIKVRPGDSGLTITAPNIAEVSEPRKVTFTVWGIPAAHEHDAERGQTCGILAEHPPICYEELGGPKPAGIPVRPYLSNPTGCGQFTATMEAYSWEEPGSPSRVSTEIEPIEECERVPFAPTLEAAPSAKSSESPAGLEINLNVPQSWENANSIATANLKDAMIKLPEGMSLNPAAGSGLGYCTEAQFGEETYEFLPGAGCPPESKIGSVRVHTPVLDEEAQGSVYVAEPFDNPFHSLLALYLTAKVPFRGIIVKAAGEVRPDPATGQLTTVVLDNPQVPFDRFTLHLNQSATSPLVTPPTCGTFTALADLTPWSAPLEPRLLSTTFPVETGVDGGPCPSGGVAPFHPLLHAGSYSNQAGAYTPFYIRLARNDGEQEITHFSIKLPPGLVGKLAGIPLCSDAAIAAAKARTGPRGGQEEEEASSCPAGSEVGHTEVEAGVGTVLASAPGKVYLAGPYHGSQLSVAAITAARVGPFDLGTVVVREALKINPETGEVSVDPTGSDPLPHIIQGIPTHLRNVRIYMDRPEFVLNPTSCKKTSTASTVLGSGKDFVSEADDNPITVSSFFQASDCAALPFKPKLRLTLKGPTRRAGDPALRAELQMTPGQANVAKAEVTLPHAEFLDQGHIGTSCTRVQFNEGAGNGAGCPANSIYGHARAITPILSEALEGPVYLRSNGGERKLPDLVAALHGSEINIDLVGFIDSVDNGQLRTRFESAPDAPVSKFVLSMFGGKKGLLKNSTDLCAKPRHAIADFEGHNGKVRDFKPLLRVRCPQQGAKKKGAGGRGGR